MTEDERKIYYEDIKRLKSKGQQRLHLVFLIILIGGVIPLTISVVGMYALSLIDVEDMLVYFAGAFVGIMVAFYPKKSTKIIL